MKNKEIRVPIRGELLALFGAGENLTLAAVHPEGFPLPLYRINYASGEWSFRDLDFTLQKITREGEVFYAAGGDKKLYKIEEKKITSLGTLDAPVVDLKARGKELFILTPGGLEIREGEKGKLLEQIPLSGPTAFDLDPSGLWIAVGFEDGRIQAFTREEEECFSPREEARVHQSAVTSLLFDAQELQVISTGTDKQLMMTQLRGQLEASERGGADGAVYGLISGPGEVFFSAGEDNLKLWPGGHTRKLPFTTKVEGPVKALCYWETEEESVVALGKSRGSIFLLPLDKKNKPTPPAVKIFFVKSWARREFENIDTRLRERTLKELAGFPDLFTVNILKERALKDPDSRLRLLGMELLKELDHKEVDQALLSLLESKDQGVRTAAFESLLKRSKLACFPILAKALETGHKDLGLKAIPLLAREASGEHQAYSRLTGELENNAFELRTVAFEELLKLHSQDPVQGIVLGLGSSWQDVRGQALKQGYKLGLLEKREFLRLVRRHLDDKSQEVRYTAFLLSLLTQPALAEVLRGKDEEIQRRLQEIDGKKPRKIGKPVLPEALRTPLIEAMATPALDICLEGAKALALIKDPRAFGVLLQLSRESAEEIRIAVCQAFSALEEPNAISRLRLLLHDSKINVADAAFSALGKLLKDQPVLLLEAGLAAPDRKIRLQGLAVLAGVLKKDPASSRGLELLAQALNDTEESVRREAFKTLLNADLNWERARVLEFALASVHKDIRLEVVMELESRKKESWARELLGKMLNDMDSFIRSECFSLLRQSPEESHGLFLKALESTYEDVRSQALELLLKSKKKELDQEDMIFSCLEDRAPGIRKKALQGLIDQGDLERLEKALSCSYLDVRIGAASAQAAYGILSALPPLLEVLRSKEPEEKEARKEWSRRIKEAMRGTALLGAEEVFDDLAALSRGPGEGVDTSFARDASWVLRFVAREKHKEILGELFTSPDKIVKGNISLALAAIGDPRGGAIALSGKNAQSLAAGFMLRHISREPLYSFMDEGDRNLRNRALLLCLLADLAESPSSPGGSLAGLAAAHLDIRLQAAGGIESYRDRSRFLECLTSWFNALFTPSWEISPEVVEELGLFVCLAPGHAALGVLEAFLSFPPGTPQDSFTLWWKVIQKRYGKELADLKQNRKEPQPGGDLLPLAVGTYVGILRLKDSSVRVMYRLSALNRLAGLSARIPEQKGPVATCLKVALHDNAAEVRNKAFDHLLPLIPLDELAAEAIATEYRDIARKAMLLLLEQGRSGETEALLKDIQMSFTNGLEEEANEVLVKQYGPVKTNAAALGARSSSLRRLGVTALSHLYEKEEAAREELGKALTSTYKDVATGSALFLSRMKDDRALPCLKEMLFSSRDAEVGQAVTGFKNLMNSEGALILLQWVEADPGHAQVKTALAAFGELGTGDAGRRALKLLSGKSSLRGALYQALLRISGFDQPLKLEKGDLKARVVVDLEEKRELDPGLVELLLEALTELGESSLLTDLIPRGAYCLRPGVDRDLRALSKFKDAGVREAALLAAAFRLRELDLPEKEILEQALKEALDHKEGDTKFLAAEGLALAGYGEGIQVLFTGADMLSNLRYRERAVLALGQLAHPRALDYLLRLGENEEHALQEAALEALGHMKETGQASRIFELLKGFARGERSGLALRALKGLRWFNSPESWQIIREEAVKPNWRVQEPAINLLAHDIDPPAAVECLRGLLRVESGYSLVRTICLVLLKLTGEDNLDGYYDFLLSPSPRGVRRAVPHYLERLCREGASSRLLESLETIRDDSVFEEVTTALLQREPLPGKEALALLEQATPRVCAFLLRLIGQSGYPVPEETLVLLAGRYWSLRVEKKTEADPFLTLVLERLAWLSGRLSLMPRTFREILEGGFSSCASICREILQALMERDSLEEEWLPVISSLAAGGESGLRPLAAALLYRAAPGEGEKLYSRFTDIPRALESLDFKARAVKDPELLSRALEGGFLSGTLSSGDIPAVSRLLESREFRVKKAALEVLGGLSLEETESLLKSFAEKYEKGREEEEDLGKLALKLARRSARQRQKREHQKNNQWLEVIR